MLTDSHTHLGSRQFEADLSDVLKRARESGVSRMIAPAVDLENTRKLISIAEAESDVFLAAGVHPCDVDTLSGEAWVAELRDLARHPKVRAIGETGLDYFHQPPAGCTVEAWRAHQHGCLRAHMEVAAELGLSVILHNRDSWDDLVALVMPYTGRVRCVFHCFTGTLDQALPLIEAGHLISFTGIVTFKNAGVIAETARDVPSGRFMLETDAPYLAPVPHRGRRCEPAFVADTARHVAALRGMSYEALAAETTQTAAAFFQLPTLAEV